MENYALSNVSLWPPPFVREFDCVHGLIVQQILTYTRFDKGRLDKRVLNKSVKDNVVFSICLGVNDCVLFVLNLQMFYQCWKICVTFVRYLPPFI